MNSPITALWISPAEANRLVPKKDYPSPVARLDACTEAHERLWSLEAVPVMAVGPGQLIDDPADDEAHAKVESMRASVRAGEFIPPLSLAHHSDQIHPYALIEGKHRYNAVHREEAVSAAEWVAHVSCDFLAPGSQGERRG